MQAKREHNAKFTVLRSLLTVAASSSSSAAYSSTLKQNTTHLLISKIIQTMFPTFLADLVYPLASTSPIMHWILARGVVPVVTSQTLDPVSCLAR